MIYPVWILGSSWHSLQPWFYLLGALVLLASGGGLYLFGIIARRLAKSPATVRPQKSTGLTLTPLLQSKAGRIGKGASLLVLGCLMGWGWRDHQFSSPPRIYTDVLVTERFDDSHFELAPARMKPWKATTCAQVDWKPGEKMKFLAFQQRLGCKDVTVAGWYEFYTNENTGKRLKFNEELANVGY